MRASEFGSCIRAQVADALGYRKMPAPEVLEEAWARGVQHEDECVDRMTRDGWRVYDQQREIEYLGITGHLDGSCFAPDEGIFRVLEIKAPNAWEKFERAYKTDTWTDPLCVRYAWQTSVYMLAMDMECVVACWDEERGVRWFVIEEPIHDKHAVELRAATIKTWIQQGEPPNVCAPVEFDDWSCPFRYLHEASEKADDTLLDDLVVEYDELGIRIKEFETMRKKVYESIGEHLGDQETVETVASKVTRYTRTTETADRDALKKDGLWEKYAKKTTSSLLRITRRGE